MIGVGVRLSMFTNLGEKLSQYFKVLRKWAAL
jgi:hypothetical protein